MRLVEKIHSKSEILSIYLSLPISKKVSHCYGKTFMLPTYCMAKYVLKICREIFSL
uniref:Uncharacterized protein n=1 Tax=Anguilla anguilla TaxID=7936 RepID=A0A0E9RLL3_ANGAN